MVVAARLALREVTVRELGRVDYATTWHAMQAFTTGRTAATSDEIWLLEHPPVYTVGLSCRPGDVANPRRIPVVRSDRGGQITYHGPGQLVAYVLIDLRRRGWGVKHLVRALEQSVIDLVAEYHLDGERRAGAPGVYVDGAKVAQLGLRVRRGASYHGLSLNVDMDLAPFGDIDPCGYPGLVTTDLAALAGSAAGRPAMAQVRAGLARHLAGNLGYNGVRSGPRALP